MKTCAVQEAAPDSTPRAERLERAHAVGACSAGDLPASPAPSLDDSGELPMFTPSVIHDPPEHYHTCATFCGDGFENGDFFLSSALPTVPTANMHS